jgi:hypothetical protein
MTGSKRKRGDVQLASLQVQETEGEKGKKGEEQDTANWLKGSHAGRERDPHSPRKGKSQVDIINSYGVVHSSPGSRQGRDLVRPRTITWFTW